MDCDCTKCKKLRYRMNQYKSSDELKNLPLATAEEERRRAMAWMDAAAFHLANEEYWRQRAKQAESKMKGNHE